MKRTSFAAVAACLLLFTVHVPGAILYVDQNSPNPTPPLFSSWSTAATNIQDAIDAANPGDEVLVTNGVYATGGKSMDGVITNRVAVDKTLTVQSVNGPGVTVIQGALDPASTNGPGAVRCVWLTNNASLRGFTLRGGATRGVTPFTNPSMDGGGVFGASTSALVYDCVITSNFASYAGGGAYSATLSHCTVTGNHAVGSGMPGAGVADAGSGGGAANSILQDCFITSNTAVQSNGGGAQNCDSTNCAFTGNRAILYGSGAYQGILVNCTVFDNTSGGYGSYGGAVASCTLVNCIAYGNYNIGSGSTNSVSCTFSYSDTDPQQPGTGNVDVDPQLLGDGVHLAATSPCIGAGTAGVVSGTDIDGQPWNNPPSIGCDEWQPAPACAAGLTYQIGVPAHGLTFNVVVAGQSPFDYFWSRNGSAIQDDGHHSNSGTANLVVNNFGPDDAGLYQVVVSNAFGMATSAVAQVVVHCVDAAGASPVSPYLSWATAATNVQDAIDAAAPGEIVLVTNGIYASGGKALSDGVTDRVALDKPLTVTSVNGYAATVIQGAWDPATTNGLLAVRCAALTDGAVLNGFTLRGGATRAFSGLVGYAAESGGGAWCSSTNAFVSNCMLTNNSAGSGAGIAYGTLNNSVLAYNSANFGGGAYSATLNNCTVVYNSCTGSSSDGGGTYNGTTRNSIVLNNYYGLFQETANYGYDSSSVFQYLYSCTVTGTRPLYGSGNISVEPQFLDLVHIASTSPCRGAGNGAYAGGTDIDGEAWANPPSMGCDEVVISNLVGPLSVNLQTYQTTLLVNRYAGFLGIIAGRASRVAWSFGDGTTITNAGASISHEWSAAGNYTVTFTAYNIDNPGGVSTNVVIHILPLISPALQMPTVTTNGFQFQFSAQQGAYYVVEVATNLTAPINWQVLQRIYYFPGDTIYISDPAPPNAARFYRVQVQ